MQLFAIIFAIIDVGSLPVAFFLVLIHHPLPVHHHCYTSNKNLFGVMLRVYMMNV